MKPQNDIASYVSNLRGRLHLRPEVLERIVTETEAHLHDRAAAHMADGMDRREAESLAVSEFGPAWRVALRFRLAYLDLKKVLALTVALVLIAQWVHGIYTVAASPHLTSHRATIIGTMLVGMAVLLAVGFAVTAISPRRLILGAGLVSSVWSAFSSWQLIDSLRRTAGSEWAGHVWNGWHSGFCVRVPSTTLNSPLHIVIYSDNLILLGLLFSFAWTLIGVWVAGGIRAKLAEMRARRAAA